MTEKKAGIRDYLSKIGPAVIVSMTIIGPGTMSALVTSGSGWYFSFFWAVILSIVFAYVATWISTKLTCVTGLSPVEALKKHTWGWLAWVLVIFNFVTQFCVMVAQGRGLRTAVITLSQVGGSEGLSSGASLIITIILFVVIVAAYFLGGSFSFVQKLTSVMLTAMLICFAITFFIALPDIKDIFLGIIPSFPPRWEGLLPDSQQWTSIAGIIGGAAGLYIYVYHGFAIISNNRNNKEWLKYGKMDAVVFTVVLFGLFSFFVFSVAAAVLYKTGEPITGVAGAAAALAPLCDPAAGYVFTIGWMGAVMTTSAGCAFFGLIPLLALMGKSVDLKDRKCQIALTVYLGVPAIIVASFVSGGALSLLTKAMSLNNLVTPPGILAFWYMTSSKKIMGEYKNNFVTNIVIAIMFFVVCFSAYNSAVSIFTF